MPRLVFLAGPVLAILTRSVTEPGPGRQNDVEILSSPAFARGPGNATDVLARTGWGEGLAVRLAFNDPLTGLVAKGDRLFAVIRPQVAHAFADR